MKRSHQVALLLMGTVAVGGGAYALMPSENCPPNQPGVQQGQQDPNCRPRSSGSGGHGSYGSGYYGGSRYSGSSPQQNFASSTSPGGSSATHPGSSGGVSRGGFGSFASHFSGGG